MVTTDKGRMNSKNWKYLLVLAPILVLAVFLIVKSVNVPNWDEWELVPILQHIHSGHIYWTDFWHQHNEHRLLIPNIILVTVAEFTRWNLRLEDYMNIVVAILSFYIIYKILKNTVLSKKQKNLPVTLLFLLSLIWFSFVQADNWLWGWQIEWFLSVLGTTIVAYLLTKINRNNFSIGQVGLLIAGGLFAQYSLGNGTLVWPILVIALLYIRVPLKKVLIVASSGILSTILYYTNYQNQDKNALSVLAKHPVTFVKYFLIYVGRPLSYLHKGAPIIGVILLVSFVAINVYLFIRNKALFNKLIPWIFIGLYAISSAIITGLARLSFGTGEAYVSRYTTISMLLVVSTIVIFYQSREDLSKLVGKSFKFLSLVTICIVFVLVLINDAWGFHDSLEHNRSLTAEMICTRLPNPSNACLLTAYPSAPVVSTRLNYLKQVHWGGY
ncbi:MAG TPA: hypothetical protein VMR34_00590 [Candidatus Saccharimonadales bacterium]|nr:hypothetical protein [Candidatus Saccharimonadales bacterium]